MLFYHVWNPKHSFFNLLTYHGLPARDITARMAVILLRFYYDEVHIVKGFLI